VTVVVFSDFQCPFCKRAAERIAELRTRYGPKIRFVFKNQPLPFHQRAEPAAQLALEARAAQGDAGFWRAHDALFASAPALDDADLDQVARSSKLDPVVARAAIGAHKHRASIQADTKLAEQLGVSGTPQFFVNGRKLVGAQPLAAFEALVDEVLPAAQALVARGVPAARVYEETIKNGVTAPSGGKGAAAPVDTAVYKVPVAGSPVLGPAAAPVTIVMFTDFQCPFCKRAVATLEELRKRRPAQVRLVFKHNPLSFHPRAEPASQLALEARAQQGDAGFWRAYEELFASAPALDDADLDAVSASLRLDGARVRGAIATHRHAAAIAADQALAGQLGAAGTPTFFVNGKILVGAQPIDKFEQIVDEVLPAAQALLKRGVPAARVYDETIKSGKSAKP
jgi:protein-disulfide isomerase